MTSKKLQSTVLGRKFTGRKTIEERKRTSACSACGAMGHWAGDAACTASASGKSTGKGKSKGKDQSKRFGTPSSSSSAPSTGYPKKAFVVTYGDEDAHDDEHQGQDTYFNFPTSYVLAEQSCKVYTTKTIDLAGYMVLDTPCQRSCAGERWFATHTKLLQNHGLSSLHQHCQDRFQFGAGRAQTATERCYMPASFRGQETQEFFLV